MPGGAAVNDGFRGAVGGQNEAFGAGGTLRFGGVRLVGDRRLGGSGTAKLGVNVADR